MNPLEKNYTCVLEHFAISSPETRTVVELCKCYNSEIIKKKRVLMAYTMVRILELFAHKRWLCSLTVSGRVLYLFTKAVELFYCRRNVKCMKKIMTLERFVRSHVQLVGFSTVWIINQELAYILHRKVKPAVKKSSDDFCWTPTLIRFVSKIYIKIKNDTISI